jgi:hypothetical protein
MTTNKEKELKRYLRIVNDVYAGHFDEYFEQHPAGELPRKAIGEEKYKQFVAILEKREDSS